MFTSVLAVAVGLVLLMLAADRLVLAAVHVSRALGVSAILIGALIVGLGTSIPELLVSTLAGGKDEVDVAMANVVGSNIANVTLVLGSATLVAPITARLRTLRREGVLMLIAVIGLAFVLLDETVGVGEGVALLIGMAVALFFLVRWSMTDVDGSVERSIEGVIDGEPRSVLIESAIGLAALAVTVFAADLLLDGALGIGEDLGLSHAFLGVMLGVGTSLPELATALASIRRGESDLVVGNVLGSNLFNSLAVAGTAAIVGPGALQELGPVAVWAMVGAAALAGLLMRTGKRIVLGEGIVLIAVFVVFAAATF